MNPKVTLSVRTSVLELLRMKAGGKSAWQRFENWCKDNNVEYTRMRDEFTFKNSEDAVAFKLIFSGDIL